MGDMIKENISTVLEKRDRAIELVKEKTLALEKARLEIKKAKQKRKNARQKEKKKAASKKEQGAHPNQVMNSLNGFGSRRDKSGKVQNNTLTRSSSQQRIEPPHQKPHSRQTPYKIIPQPSQENKGGLQIIHSNHPDNGKEREKGCT